MACKVEPSRLSMFCEIHGCTNRVNWAIGNPVAPRTRMMVCNNCLKELTESIPREMWPEVEETKGEAISKPITNTKVYTCDYCGESFERPGDKGNHSKICTKNPKNKGKSGKPS